MLITGVIIILTGIVSTQDTPISKTNTSYNQPTQTPEQSTSLAKTSTDWAKYQLIAYIILGILGFFIVGILIPFLIAWCSGDLKKLEEYCSRRRSRQSGRGGDVTNGPLGCRSKQSGGGDVPDGSSAYNMAEIQEATEETSCLPSSSTASNPGNEDWKKKKPDSLKHFSDVEKLLTIKFFNNYFITLGLKDINIGKVIRGSDPDIDFEKAAKDVFIFWRQRKANQATLEALKIAFKECGFDEQSVVLLEKWDKEKRDYSEKIKDQDMYPIIEEFTIAELRKLFGDGLKIKRRDVDIHMGSGADTREQVIRLFHDWQQKKPEGTLGDLLAAFGDNEEAKQELSKKWRDPKY